MKRFLLLLSVLVAVSCATTPKPVPAEGKPIEAPPQGAQKNEPEAMKEAASTLLGRPLQPPPSEDESLTPASPFFTDPKTGERFQRIPKEAPYYEKDGSVFNSILRGGGVPYTKQDDRAWYISAPLRGTPTEEAIQRKTVTFAPKDAYVPESESEIVTPRISKTRLTLEEISEGLPIGGFWRENMALADLEGDGKLEIVTPPARLSSSDPTIFRLEKDQWKRIAAKFDFGDLGVDYGGVEAADLDGDGKPDLVMVSHGLGGGPVIAFNKGGYQFKVESRGLLRSISSRAVAVADLDGDGRPDVLTLSDESEKNRIKEAGHTDPKAGDVREDGSTPGYDLRTFFATPAGNYVENHVGLWDSCYGYVLAAWASPPDGGAPIVASGCRVLGATAVLFIFNRTEKTFQSAGLDFAEAYAVHYGVALGTYMGHPAAFYSYAKVGPESAPQEMTSAGVSIYYREKGTWTRKRLLKFPSGRLVGSQGIAVGDLDGDGLDDVVYADDNSHRIRIFFQRPGGEFEEMETSLEPTYENRSTSVRIGDVDGDGRKDIVLMFQTATGERTRSGGLRYFRNVGTGK